MAEILGIDLKSAKCNEIEGIIARYNGFGNLVAEYGRETKQYYDLFKQYNN